MGSLQTTNTTLCSSTTLFGMTTDHRRKRRKHMFAKLQTSCLVSNVAKPGSTYIQSNGLSNHTDPASVDQMTRKHPAQKAPITTLSNDEMRLPKKGIDRDMFLQEIRVLKADVAPGLGCLCNKHLLALAVDQSCQMMPSAAAAIDNYLNYANAVVRVQMLLLRSLGLLPSCSCQQGSPG